ncbi:MAG: pyrroline-5-carboxylate reductase [Clostridia bacterium]|nr:pyrroline-5-carboxylate reductase [Clostridia bacterium]
MRTWTVGLIGIGNMGGSILRGMVEQGCVKAGQVFVYDADMQKLDKLSQEMPALNFCDHALTLAEEADVILLCVKPHILPEVAETIMPALNESKSVISIAAGWTAPRLRALFSESGAAVLRVMPNTPALVGEGMTALCEDTNFSEEALSFARTIFESLGRTVTLPERMFDGVTAISGSSPAYVYTLIEAMADAGVREGIPRQTAIEMAAQSVLGAALMVLSSGDHPAVLRDAVCSPGGTTIEAVAAMEESGFRHAVIRAMEACANKSREMARERT